VSAPGSSVNRAPRPSGLADVLELVLDRGIVIDAYVRWVGNVYEQRTER
jgi:hypothetical protein